MTARRNRPRRIPPRSALLLACALLVAAGCSSDSEDASKVKANKVSTTTSATAGGTDDTVSGGAENPAGPGAGPTGSPTTAGNGSTGATGGGGSAAPSVGSTVGTTAKSIKISVTGPFSGAYGTLYNKLYTNGVETWQKEVNAAGGINGRRLELVKVDDQYNADGSVAACKDVKGNGSFIVLNMASVGGLDECLEAAGIPTFDVLPATWNSDWRNILGFAYYASFAPTEVSYFKSADMNAGSKKIGMLYETDLPQFVAEAEAVQKELAKANMNLVDVEKVTSTQASYVSEMGRMKSKGVEVVLAYASLNFPGMVRDARAVGLSPTWYTSANLDVIAQSGGAVLQGVRTLRAYTSSDTKEFAAFAAKVRKYSGDAAAERVESWDAQYYAAAAVLGEMIRLTGPNLGRTSFLTAARGISNFTADGLIGPFTLKGRDILSGARALFPTVCCNPNSTWKATGPPREQF